MNEQIEEELFTLQEVMEKLNLPRSTFYRIRKLKIFPKPIQVTNSPRGQRWTLTQLNEFVKKRRAFILLQQTL